MVLRAISLIVLFAWLFSPIPQAQDFAADGQAARVPPNEAPHVQHYNILGKTGLRVSDIGFGVGSTTDPALLEYALDAGINYFDTAENYSGGHSEEAVGQLAARRRSEMIICTKIGFTGTTTRQEAMERVAESLRRLQTDYIDILMIHGGAREAVDNPEIYIAFDSLKSLGKVHFTGVSHHGPDISTEMRRVIEAGKLDVILCSYDPAGDPEIPAMLAEAAAKGFGLVGMKVLTSARAVELPEFKSGEYPFHIAALRWALKTSGMHTIIPTLTMMDQIDEYLAASGAIAE